MLGKGEERGEFTPSQLIVNFDPELSTHPE
jgi:hypothetical protein